MNDNCPHYLSHGSSTTQLWFDLQKDKRCLYCRIDALAAELAAMTNDRNYHRGACMTHCMRIRELEAALLKLCRTCNGELGCKGYRVDEDLGLTLETEGK